MRKRRPLTQKTYYYFAYGSNMLQQRLEERVGRVRRIGTGFLDGYRMKFNCAAIQGRDSMSFANVGRQDGQRAFGVIYELTARQLVILDEYEQLYYRITRRINGRDCEIYISKSYARVPELSIPPTEFYIRILLAGYLQNGYREGHDALQRKMLQKYKVKIEPLRVL
jgi:gamma-glutamylcyclotransferase